MPYVLVKSAILAAVAIGCPQPQPIDQAKRQPGLWKVSQVMVRYTPPRNLPPEMQKAMIASFTTPQLGENCLAEANLTNDNFSARLANVVGFSSEWKTVRSAFVDGRVDFEALLDDPAQGRGRATISGTLSPTTTALVLRMDATDTDNIRSSYEQHFDEARIGDCVDEFVPETAEPAAIPDDPH